MSRRSRPGAAPGRRWAAGIPAGIPAGIAAVSAVAVLAGCGSSRATDSDPARAPAPSTDALVAAAALERCPVVRRGPTGGGSPALPSVTLDCLGAGPAVPMAGLKGPALVNLWAAWCGPCRREMPTLQALHRRAGARLAVLGIVTDDSRRNALDAARALGVTYPSLLDTAGTVRRSFGLPGPPVTLFVDRRGRIVHRVVGEVPALAALQVLVDRHLGVAL